MKKTVAQLRSEAWDLEQKGNYRKAAKLVGEAITGYGSPGASQLAKADIEGLKRRKKDLESMF